MSLVKLVPPALQMSEGHFGVLLIEAHHIFGVLAPVLRHQFPHVLNGVEEQHLLRTYLLPHQQYKILQTPMQASETGKRPKTKEDMIQEILSLQQEISAFEERSQLLQHQNKFYETQIEQLRSDIEKMEAQLKQ